jgi:hypothetical protein
LRVAAVGPVGLRVSSRYPTNRLYKHRPRTLKNKKAPTNLFFCNRLSQSGSLLQSPIFGLIHLLPPATASTSSSRLRWTLAVPSNLPPNSPSPSLAGRPLRRFPPHACHRRTPSCLPNFSVPAMVVQARARCVLGRARGCRGL